MAIRTPRDRPQVAARRGCAEAFPMPGGALDEKTVRIGRIRGLVMVCEQGRASLCSCAGKNASKHADESHSIHEALVHTFFRNRGRATGWARVACLRGLPE